MPQGPVRVRAAAPDTWFQRYGRPPSFEVPANTPRAEIVLPVAGAASGRVLGPKGRPIAYPLVHVFLGGDRVSTVLGEADGSFRASVPIGRRADLVFSGDVGSEDPTGEPFKATGLTARVPDVTAGMRDVVLRAEPVATGGTPATTR